MARRPKLHIPEPNDIEKLVNENYTIYKIRKHLVPIIGGKISHYIVRDYIKEHYNKEWDEENKKWISCYQNTSNVPTINSIEEKHNTSDCSNDEIQKILNAILTKITRIEKDVNLLKELSSNSPQHKTSDNLPMPEDIVKIWNSNKSKKSISINTELIHAVQEVFSNIYGIHDNDSKVIDTALLLALLKYKR